MDPEHVEVKLHGKWIPVLDLPAHSCLSDVESVTESATGYLEVVTESGNISAFRPVEWRTVED